MDGISAGIDGRTHGSTISSGRTYSITGPNHATGKHSSVPVSAASGAL